MNGKLYALSTGPGAPDLITVRAARILGSLDILYAPAGRKGGDSLALSIVRDYLGEQTEVRCCHFPMSADGAEKEAVWNEVAAALTAEVKAGKQVGFITLGDAMLFSTWIFFTPAYRLPGVAGDCPRRHVLRRDSRPRENAARHRTAIAGGYFLYRAGSGNSPGATTA